MAERTERDGLRGVMSNLGGLLKNLKTAVVRHGPKTTQRARAETVFGNVFLHIHATRTHRWSLRKSFTCGLGVASAALFGILLFTGVLLMIYFKPTTATAYNSVKDIQFVVPGGRIIRNVHRWSAHLMVAAVLMHMFRVMLTGSYRKPREFNWLIGLLLLVLTLALSFTGYCLPWDQLGYWATTIGVNIASSTGEVIEASGWTSAPDVPGLTKEMMLGSRSIGDDAMLRFYVLHCIVLPLAMLGTMAVHFWRIRKDGGMSRPSNITDEDLKGTPEESQKITVFKPEKTYGLMAVVKGSSPMINKGPDNTVQSWPSLFYYEMAVAMAVLFVVLLAGIVFNAPLAEIANPNVPENPAKAPWYFLGLQECVSYSAFSGGMLIPTICVVGLGLIPFVDRGTESGRLLGGKSEIGIFVLSSLFAAVVTVGMLAFTVEYGWMRKWWPDINQMWIILFNPGTILAAIYTAYVMIIVFLRKSIRQGIVAYSACFIVGFIILTYFGSVHRGPNWQFYWWPSQWPIH